MNDEFHDIESRLSGLRPAPADAALLTRLEAAADGSLLMLTPEEGRFEAELGSRVPASLSPDFLRSLEKVAANTPFHVDEKIVMFTRANTSQAPARRYRPWAAAAAVALLGAATALFIPVTNHSSRAPTAAISPTERSHGNPGKGVVNADFVPAGHGHNLQDAKDEGIVWKNNVPHRVYRIEYKDLTSFTNAEGKKVEVEQPREELILIPEKID